MPRGFLYISISKLVIRVKKSTNIIYYGSNALVTLKY